MKLFTSEPRDVCKAQLETKEGATYTGYLRMPMSGDTELKLFDDLALTQSAGTFNSEDMKGIELSNPKKPDSSYRFEYKKTQISYHQSEGCFDRSKHLYSSNRFSISFWPSAERDA